ncbi:L,D-transpeptidase [Amycolatopsis rhizosphaerae]|nr:L,D-transpeptidase family protein [Amycolatopsis rhizosphaerae]
MTGTLVGAVVATGAFAMATPAAEAAAAPCDAAAKACLQLHTHRAWLMNRGAVAYGPVPVTVGRPGHVTPQGRFSVLYKDLHHYSTEYNGPMPYSVFFTRTGVAFHEGSLSVPSHGCVHLSHDAAVTFFQKLRPGDTVEVVN